MKMQESDFRLLMKACLLLCNVSDGVLQVRCPEGMEGVYEPDQYMLTIAEEHRLRGIRRELSARLEILNEVRVL